ncbi:MAG TPA: hypothetical protein VGX96_04340 [Candidatus Elarobacter sp.]|jgi:hypothetical protein|nr:hypothetical protein [Candidatus Elarobacter sp.]
MTTKTQMNSQWDDWFSDVRALVDVRMPLEVIQTTAGSRLRFGRYFMEPGGSPEPRVVTINLRHESSGEVRPFRGDLNENPKLVADSKRRRRPALLLLHTKRRAKAHR